MRIEQELDRWLDGEARIVTAGDTVRAPEGRPHSHGVESADGVTWMMLTRRGDFEALVRAVARLATAPGLPAPGVHPTLEVAAPMAEVCAGHGIRVVGEPLAPQQAA